MGAIATMMTGFAAPGLPSDLISFPVDVPPIHVGDVFRMPRVTAALTILFACMAAAGLIGVLVPVDLAARGVSDLLISLVFSISPVLWTSGSLLGGDLVKRFSPVRVMHLFNAAVIATLIFIACVAGGPLAVSIAFLSISFLASLTQAAACCVLVLDARDGQAMIPLATGWKLGMKCFGEAFGNLAGGALYDIGGLKLVGSTFTIISVIMTLLYELIKQSTTVKRIRDLEVPLLNPVRSRSWMQRCSKMARKLSRWVLLRFDTIEELK